MSHPEVNWKDVTFRLYSICPDSKAIHRIVIDWDDRKDAQHYVYKAYDKDRVLVCSGPVTDMVPLKHTDSDMILVSALVWVGFGLETPIHRSDCIVERTEDNCKSRYVVWDRSYKDRRIDLGR